ncbi:alpha/beta fold hydrolase [Ahrensia sp. R2A130]|uniref:alpha/beta fold hydrolase n=1 Tax=Ahrensia sp. R2A130 TaxID=744979 RepID=UPI001FFF9C4D|nr:alpha/beta hydrolase [Ahrensia sp. R2A130]
MPADGRFLEVNGNKLHYVDSADGDPNASALPSLVLIHGLGGQLRNLTHSLSQRLTKDFRVITMDRIGAGYSTRSGGGGATLHEHATAVSDLIGALELDRPVLVGHSMGGAVSLATALDHAGSIRGAVLVAPLTAASENVPEVFGALAIRNDTIRKIVAHTVAVPISILRAKKTLAYIFKPEPVPEDFRIRGGGLLGLRPQSFRSTSMDFTSLFDTLPVMVERYADISVPIAIIFGTKDSLLDHNEHGVDQHDLYGWDVELLEGSGHMIPVTAPDQVANYVSRHAKNWFSIS